MTEYIWLPHDSLVFIPAKVIENEGGVSSYRTLTGEEFTFSNDKLNPASLERVSENSLKSGVNNLVNLDEFGEGAVIHQLRERYRGDQIYTTIGTILVSVNPYRLLPIYAAAQVDQYKQAASAGPLALGALDPHVYSIAAEAYTKLYEDDASDKPNQAIIISGESGAGKTEATKTVLQYLSEVAGSVSGVEQMILQSNPILEGFGNARTLRNNNSSRFGKWMEVHFEPVAAGVTGKKIIAAKIINYLLERSRITTQTKGERSYHIFYQLCAGLSTELKQRFGLTEPQDYHYLNQSDCYTIDGIDELEEFEKTSKAMHELRFDTATIESIWRLLVGILQIGNLDPQPNPMKTDVTTIANKEHLQRTTETLGLSSSDVLSSALCYRSVTIRGSISMIPLNKAEVEANRDALAKTIYGKLFDYMIVQMNQVLFANGDQTPMAAKTDAQKKGGRSIGILDIFGFEIFDNNMFEQLCINYTNEKLQQHFNMYIFKLEQQEYNAEGIDVAHIAFVDNIECLNLIEGRPGGILGMLDEELVVPQGSDASLITKMHTVFANTKGKEHKHYGVIKKNPEIFIIRHYAGEVAYNSQGLLAKNKNKLNDNLEQLMSGGSSRLKLVTDIFLSGVEGAEEKKDSSSSSSSTGPLSPPGRRGGAGYSTLNSPSNAAKKKEQTLAYQFYGQLQDLMATLHSCNPHYIRCLKPNANKAPREFDTRMVLKQMSYAGLFEAIRIRKSGFPFRKLLDEFGKRYKVCLSKSEIVEYSKKSSTNVQDGVSFLLAALTPHHLTANQYQVGKTKVFLKTSQRNILDALRDANLTKWAVQVQAFWRMARAKLLRKKLTAFQKQCRELLDSDCTEDQLTALLTQATDAGFHHYLFIIRRLQATIAALNEVSRVIRLLEEAIANNELPALEGGLEQVTRLHKSHGSVVPADYVSPITLIKQLGLRTAEATKQRDHLLEAQRLQQELRNAIMEESISALQIALDAATAFGLDSHLSVVVQAQKLLKQLKEEEAIMESLRQATKARDAPLIESLMKEVRAKDISLDGTRHHDMATAYETMKSVYNERVRSLMNATGESELKSVWLSKMKSLSLNDIVTSIETYLREAEAERQRIAAEEAARAREEARRVEEARLALERAHLAAEEKARLEEQDRVRRAEEDRLREEQEEAARKAAAEAAAVAMAADSSSSSSSFVPPPPFSDLPPPPSDDLPPPPAPDDSLPPPPAPDDSLPPPPAPDDDLPPPPSDFDLAPPPVPSRPLAPSFAGPATLAEHPIDVELDAAILKRSLPMLERAIANANALKHNSRLVRIAQNMSANLQAESKIRTDLLSAINRVDVDKCKSLIKAATAIGFLKDPLIEEARSISYGLSPAELIALRIQKALPQGNAEELRSLLKEAAELKPTPLINNEQVEQAKDWLAAQITRGAASSGNLESYRDLSWETTMRVNRVKLISPSEYSRFSTSRGTYPLNETVFLPLRRAGNYAKGGGKEKSKSIKLQAKQTFKNVRGYMRDVYHSYPSTLAYDIIMSGVSQPLLRDEIYCQLIKQTSSNPSQESLLLGLKLLYLCLSTFPPSPGLKLCLWSHISQFAHSTLPEGTALGFQLPTDVASACYGAMEHVAALTAANIPIKPPTMNDIENMTNGTLAKRSGRFDDAIKAASSSSSSSSHNRVASHIIDDFDLPAPPPPPK